MASNGETQPLLGRQNSRLSQPSLGRQSSWLFVPSDEAHAVKHEVPSSVRNDFIKKVYCILGCEIALTALMCAAFIYYVPLQAATVAFVKAHTQLWFYSQFATLFPTICALMLFKNHYPTNFILTLVFVTLMSLYVGSICALYASVGKSDAIFQAVLITAVIFFALSIYCHVSKTDFSFMGGYLYVSLIALTCLGFICMVMQTPLLTFIYQCCGVLLFTLYILYDTSMIIHHYGPDDYIIASVELYLDLINLFLYILSLLGDR